MPTKLPPMNPYTTLHTGCLPLVSQLHPHRHGGRGLPPLLLLGSLSLPLLSLQPPVTTWTCHWPLKWWLSCGAGP